MAHRKHLVASLLQVDLHQPASVFLPCVTPWGDALPVITLLYSAYEDLNQTFLERTRSTKVGP